MPSAIAPLLYLATRIFERFVSHFVASVAEVAESRERPTYLPALPGGMPLSAGMPVHRVVSVLQENNIVKAEEYPEGSCVDRIYIKI